MFPLMCRNMWHDPTIRRKACTFLYLPLSSSLACFHTPSICLFLQHTHTLTCAYITTLSRTNTAEGGGEEKGEWRWLVMGMCLGFESHPKKKKKKKGNPSCPPNMADRPSCYQGGGGGGAVHRSVNRSGCSPAALRLVLANCSGFLCHKSRPISKSHFTPALLWVTHPETQVNNIFVAVFWRLAANESKKSQCAARK